MEWTRRGPQATTQVSSHPQSPSASCPHSDPTATWGTRAPRALSVKYLTLSKRSYDRGISCMASCVRLCVFVYSCAMQVEHHLLTAQSHRGSPSPGWTLAFIEPVGRVILHAPHPHPEIPAAPRGSPAPALSLRQFNDRSDIYAIDHNYYCSVLIVCRWG